MQPSLGNSQSKKNHESRVIRCPNCGHHNPSGQKFCGTCGSSLQEQIATQHNVSAPVALMAKSHRQSKRIPVAISVAIITVIGTIIVAVINLVHPLINSTSSGSGEITIIAHVTNLDDNTAIVNAQVLVLAKGVSYIAYTDTQGIAAFTIDQPEKGNTQVFVQAAQYVAYDANVPLEGDQNFDIPLTPEGSGDHHVIVRVVDNNTGAPLDGASVVLTENGSIFSQPTDSNGIVKFVVPFTSSLLDAQIQVSTTSFKTNQQNVTLRPEMVQDIRLDRSANTFQVADFQPSGSISAVSADPRTITYGQSLAGVITAPGQVNVYTFQGKVNDAILIRLTPTTPNMFATIRLFGSDGKELTYGNGAASSFNVTFTLPTSDIYKFTVEMGSLGSTTGAYGLSLQKTN